MRFFYAFYLLLFMITHPVHAQQEGGAADSIPYIFPELQFDSTESTNRYVHPDGLTLRYPFNWERDYRAGSETLLVYVRKVDPKYPQVFRDRVSLRALGFMDSTQNLVGVADSYNANEQKVWAQYTVNYRVLSSSLLTIQSDEALLLRIDLPELSQEKLVLFFQHKNKVYLMEYASTDISFRLQLENFWRMVNSIGFMEK